MAQLDNIERVVLIGALIVAATMILRSASQSRWEQFSSREGAFRVLMPGKPKQEALSFQVSDVKVKGQSFSAWSRTNSEFTVAYADASVLPATVRAESILEAQGQVLTQGDERRMLSIESMTLNGYPVRQYKAIAEDGSEADERVYLVKHRLYTLLVLHDRKRDEPDAKRFFDSFAFEEKQ